MNFDEFTADDRIRMEKISKNLREAFKGLGTDEEQVIRDLTRCNNLERQLLKKNLSNLIWKKIRRGN